MRNLERDTTYVRLFPASGNHGRSYRSPGHQRPHDGSRCRTGRYDHPSTKTVTSSNLSITRSIVGDGEVAPGGYVTIRTKVSTTGHPDRYVNKMVDRYPVGLTYKEGSATIDAWHLFALAQKTESVSPLSMSLIAQSPSLTPVGTSRLPGARP